MDADPPGSASFFVFGGGTVKYRINVQLTDLLVLDCVLMLMRPIVAIVVVFGFLAWDLSSNNGRLTEKIQTEISHISRLGSLR